MHKKRQGETKREEWILLKKKIIEMIKGRKKHGKLFNNFQSCLKDNFQIISLTLVKNQGEN